ncbi:hypothetical protein RB195_009750 [Necator americanus]|uniref:Ig-like domain-containing protein n=1 Tax=Necator americanus TaxID=51031 RepID=A0ABR1CUR3_NECAM
MKGDFAIRNRPRRSNGADAVAPAPLADGPQAGVENTASSVTTDTSLTHPVDNRNTRLTTVQNRRKPPQIVCHLPSSSSYSLENSESQAIALISTWKVTSVAVTPTASRVTLRCVITDISLSQV